MGGWREAWETTDYRERLRDERDFLRVRIRVERGRLVRYMAPYEAVIEGRIYPVVRYDNAHGFPHRDRLDWRGQVMEKLPFYGVSNAAALDNGKADIKANWRAYRVEFLRRRR